jgi:hypothetical protein
MKNQNYILQLYGILILPIANITNRFGAFQKMQSIKKDQLWISSRDEKKSVKINYYDAGTNLRFFSYCQFVNPTLCIYE